MQHVVKNSSPSTYYIQFLQGVDSFSIVDKNNKPYYYRYFKPGTTNVKVNIPDPGVYYFSKDANIKRVPLEIVREVRNIRLPKQERNREKNYFIRHDNNEVDSPALIYTETGEIITGRKFNNLSIPMKIFILLHEIGHFKYQTEKYCDLYATVEFIKMGYNPSTAIYCLTDELRHNINNDERINYVYNELFKAGIIK